jgi:tripartite-type tricarboxylate transporter receptor subunit TctC
MAAMKTRGLKTLGPLAAFVGFLAGIEPGAAQDWPMKPVRIIVPFGAGATPDIVARLLAERMQGKLKQSFVIENKPGASGNLGTEAVAKAEPDGATIGLSIVGPLALNTLLFSKLSYNPFTDLALISRIVDQPSVLAVNAEVPARSTSELIALLKREPGKLNFGSIGNGSLSHLAMEAIAMLSGTTLVHIPYASSPQAMTALIRGDVQMACLPAASVASQVPTGRIRMLAVTSQKRSPLLPDVPTLKEAGVDVEANAWIGLIAPARTPEPAISAVAREVAEALRDPAIGEKLKALYMEPLGTSPAEFRAHVEAEMKRWTPVIRARNIKIN